MRLEPQAEGIPLPRPTALSAPHWEGARRGELLAQRCRDCGAWAFPPRPACTRCLGGDLEWARSGGRGAVYSYTVVHRPQQPSFAAPYVCAIAELDEGWHMLTALVGLEPAEARVGLRVEVAFRPAGEDIALPDFRPAP